MLKNVVIAMQNPPFLSLDSNGRPIGFFGCRANLSIQFLFCVLFYFEKKKKENSNRNPFKIRLFVSSCICEYVKPFSAGRIQWLLFARPVYELGMITYLAAGAFLF